MHTLAELRSLCDEAEALIASLEHQQRRTHSERHEKLRLALKHADERFNRRLRKLYSGPRRVTG